MPNAHDWINQLTCPQLSFGSANDSSCAITTLLTKSIFCSTSLCIGHNSLIQSPIWIIHMSIRSARRELSNGCFHSPSWPSKATENGPTYSVLSAHVTFWLPKLSHLESDLSDTYVHFDSFDEGYLLVVMILDLSPFFIRLRLIFIFYYAQTCPCQMSS